MFTGSVSERVPLRDDELRMLDCWILLEGL